MLNIEAIITGAKYQPFLCNELKQVDYGSINEALQRYSRYILRIDNYHSIAISWWVSPKRTRTYPYARIYDTLTFGGKRATIIPVFKDEGAQGDRDFIQWDTISLMSLLGVYVIISFYEKAQVSNSNLSKITKQRFNPDHIKNEIERLLVYHSDALHWNIEQADKAGEVGEKAIAAYNNIMERTGVKLHSLEIARDRFKNIGQGADHFLNYSRNLAKRAQASESVTRQPKEVLDGEKAMLTIKNYLGGEYYFTADEAKIVGDTIYLIEGKHSKKSPLPSNADIKDGLLKMFLFSNLSNVTVGSRLYHHQSILKLTSSCRSPFDLSRPRNKDLLERLEHEAKRNNFIVQLD